MTSNSHHEIISRYIRLIEEESYLGQLKAVFFDIPKFDCRCLIPLFSFDAHEVLFVRHTFKVADKAEPYMPFLSLIKRFFITKSREEIEQIFESLAIYPLHRTLLMAYFFDEPIKRQESLITEELYYEIKKMEDNVIALLGYISHQQKIILGLDAIQYATPSTIRLLCKLLKMPEAINFILIGSLSDVETTLDSSQEYYANFLEILEEQSIRIPLFDIAFDDNHFHEALSFQPSVEGVALLKLHDAFMCYEDLIYQGLSIYAQYSAKGHYGRESSYIRLLSMLSRAYYFIRDTNSALMYNNIALNDVQSNYQLEETCELLCHLGYIFLMRMEYKQVKKLVFQGIQKAILLPPKIRELMIYEFEFLHFLADKESMYQYVDEVVYYEALIEKSKSHHRNNHLAMLLTNPYSLYYHFDESKRERFHEGIMAANLLRNEHRMGVAYHFYGIVFSEIGDYEQAFHYYTIGKEIKTRIGNDKRLAYVYNSLGYYYFVKEDYEASLKEYKTSLLASLNDKDYKEICMTLYNIALNALFAKNHLYSLDVFTKLMSLMKLTRIKALGYHSKKMITFLMILNHLALGNQLRANELYVKAKLWGYDIIPDKDEEKAMELLVDALLDTEPESCLSKLRGVREFLPKATGVLYHYRMLFYEWYLRKLDENGDATFKEVLKLAIEEATDKKLQVSLARFKLFEAQGMQVELPPSMIQENISIEYERVIHAATLDKHIQQLQVKINEINFINLVQNAMMNEYEIEGLLVRIMQSLHASTTVDASYCRWYDEGEWRVVSGLGTGQTIDKDKADAFLAVIAEDSPILIRPGTLYDESIQNGLKLGSMVYLPIHFGQQVGIQILLGTKLDSNRFQHDDLTIFTLMMKQLKDAIERIKQSKALHEANDKLGRMASTDVLSGLNNRHALDNHLRFLQKKSRLGMTMKPVIIFIDLDNFKYYNDNFGHPIGDKIITQFAQLLRSITMPTDFLSRYGGDEFVMVVERHHRDDINRICQRLYDALASMNYFEDFVSELMGYQVTIGQRDRLSCSIGISEYDKESLSDLDKMLRSADEALYVAKRQGKGKVIWWENTQKSPLLHEDRRTHERRS